MNHRQKFSPRHRQHPAYRQAFGRLDLALAENTASYTLEKLDEIRRTLFGSENQEDAGKPIEEVQKMPEETSS